MQADEGVDEVRMSSELTVGGIDLLPGQWLTTELLTLERPVTPRVSVFATLPVAATWSRTHNGLALGNVTLGVRGTVARGHWSGGSTRAQLVGSFSTATASTSSSGATGLLAERFHSAHSLGLWQPDTTTARTGAELRYERGTLRGELSLSGAVAIHDTLSFSRADTSVVAFVAARGESTLLRRLIVGAGLTSGLALSGRGDERFTHLLELSAGTEWRRSRASVGVYAPIDASYRDAGIWGVVCSIEVAR